MKTALAKVVAPEETRSTAIVAFDAAAELPALFKLAHALVQAKGFIPSHLRNEGEIVATILAGRELGLPPMTALRSIYIVEGKVSLASDLQLALMLRAGVRSEWLETSDKAAKLRLERPGSKPAVFSYTLEQAKRAGLAGKGNWEKHTEAMLRARCVSAAAKAYAPDVLAGVYVPDEIEEISESRVEHDEPVMMTTQASVAAQLEASSAVAEEQARMRLESDALCDQWKLDLEKLTTPKALETWCHFHGFEMSAMHRNAQARMWTAIRKRCDGLEVPHHVAKQWLRDAPEMPSAEDAPADEPGANDEPDEADVEAQS